MAFGNGPSIVTNGLVLSLDAADRNSYPGSGTTWRDLSGNNNTGTLTNGPTFSSANGGNILLDGTNDYVALGTSLGNAFSSISVSCWIRPTTFVTNVFAFEYILGACDNSSGGLESVFNLGIAHTTNTTNLPATLKGNCLFFGVRSAGQSNRNRPITIADATFYLEYTLGMAISVDPVEYALNVPMNLTGTYNGTTTLLYINGQQKASSASQPNGTNGNVSGVLNTSSVDRAISTPSLFTGNFFSGLIYNRALSAQEVLQNYNATKTRFGL